MELLCANTHVIWTSALVSQKDNSFLNGGKKNKETVEASILALNRATKDSLHPRLRCAAVLQNISSALDHTTRHGAEEPSSNFLHIYHCMGREQPAGTAAWEREAGGTGDKMACGGFWPSPYFNNPHSRYIWGSYSVMHEMMNTFVCRAKSETLVQAKFQVTLSDQKVIFKTFLHY